MERSACLDGSDTPACRASSYSERCSALKIHLSNAALILESFDHIVRGDLKRDEEYKDVIKRIVLESEKVLSAKVKEKPYDWNLLYAPISSPLSLQPKGTATKGVAKEPGLPKNSLALPANQAAQHKRTKEYPTGVLTIHFLVGSPNCSLDQIVRTINKGLKGRGHGRVDGAWQPDPESLQDLVPYAQKRIILNCSRANRSDTLRRMIANLELSSLWTEGTVVHVRERGKTDYFMTLRAEHDVPADTWKRNVQNITEQINSYLHQTSERIMVTKVLSPDSDIFRFTGPSAKHLKMIRATGLLLTIGEGRNEQLLPLPVVLQPFQLCDFKVV